MQRNYAKKFIRLDDDIESKYLDSFQRVVPKHRYLWIDVPLGPNKRPLFESDDDKEGAYGTIEEVAASDEGCASAKDIFISKSVGKNGIPTSYLMSSDAWSAEAALTSISMPGSLLIGEEKQKKEEILSKNLVMPKAFMSMKDFFKDNLFDSATWEQCINFCIQLADQLTRLHNRGERSVLHRDIKPANILLFACPEKKTISSEENKDMKGGRPSVPPLYAVFADFGGAKPYRPTSDKGMMSLPISGTPAYAPPEMVSSNNNWVGGDKSDVFSFGLVLIQLLGGGNITQGRYRSDKTTQNRYDPSRPLSFTLRPTFLIEVDILKILSDFLQRMIHPNYDQRPSAAEVLKFFMTLRQYRFISQIVSTAPEYQKDLKNCGNLLKSASHPETELKKPENKLDNIREISLLPFIPQPQQKKFSDEQKKSDI